MKVPEVKRCCCCFPLRHGIIMFGLINIVSNRVTGVFWLYFVKILQFMVKRKYLIYHLLECQCRYMSYITTAQEITQTDIILYRIKLGGSSYNTSKALELRK